SRVLSFSLSMISAQTLRVCREEKPVPTFPDHALVKRQPNDLARRVAKVAVSRLGEGVGQLPFLRFVAPLRGRVRDDVIRAAVRADRRTPCRPCRPPVDVLGLFLLRIERIEK
ncbi:MAG: hypothetical protein ACLQDM_26910, partial [Bradyrhizobium sp.]